MITFKEQFDKLTRAYIAEEVNPYSACACFIGNLLNGEGKWDNVRNYQSFGESHVVFESLYWMKTYREEGISCINEQSKGMYSAEQIVDMENVFLRTLEEKTIGHKIEYPSLEAPNDPNYENALFEAFCVTLDLLKSIHEAKGEKVDEFIFEKRILQTA